MTSLYIKNGKDISGFPLEVLIEDKKIAQIGPKLSVITADYEIDLQNSSYISAGWIDDHVHCYEKLSLYYDDPDKVGYLTGVTTVIDAGSTMVLPISSVVMIPKRPASFIGTSMTAMVQAAPVSLWRSSIFA